MSEEYVVLPAEGVTFGPVPSRRLGRSLGVNNVPPKYCSYSCIYCQVGATLHGQPTPRSFYDPKVLVESVREKIAAVEAAGDRIDYLTVVPDGEPTLDANLFDVIRGLKETGYRVAVITNATLLHDKRVRSALFAADWVSVKVDTVDVSNWKSIHRPHPSIELDSVLSGIGRFRSEFRGVFVTETMLVDGINTDQEALERTARFVGSIGPDTAYIAVPTRPPADPRVVPAPAHVVTAAYARFLSYVDKVELLTGYEGNEFAATGNTERDLLSITAVHPMRFDAVAGVLTRNKSDWSEVVRLIAAGKLVRTNFGDQAYYVRRAAAQGMVTPAGS